jgi:arylsulfatase A-like enzyme
MQKKERYCAMKKRFSLERSWITAFSCLPFLHADGAARSPAADEDRPPNIVFILADDLGFTDINAYAEKATGVPAEGQFYETPHLNRLAAEGLSFYQARATHLCSPTRASLLTGKNAARIGFMTATPHMARSWHSYGMEPPKEYLAQDAVYWGDRIATPQALLNGSTLLALPDGLPGDRGRSEPTFAEVLTEYRSVFIGKWHVGGHGTRGYQPSDRGFETISFFDAGASPYFDWRERWNQTEEIYPERGQDPLGWGSSGESAGEEYLTDELTAQAVRFIRSRADEGRRPPFLLYLCHFAPHTPLEAKPEDVKHFENKSMRGWNGHHNPVYAAMIKSLDDSVGAIRAALEETGLAENTLVVFMSDNGGVSFVTKAGNEPVTCNAPLKGGKAMLFEGGVRVPLIFNWPGRIAAGQWSDVPVEVCDLFPTLLEVTGRDVAPFYRQGLDGRSLVPLFTDPDNSGGAYPRDTFYWHYPFNVAPLHPDDHLPLTPHSAIRRRNFKLIYDWYGRLYLYDTRQDPYEQTNLAESRPELARELFMQLNAWIDENVSVRYTPALNPAYDPATEVRAIPFTDLRRKYLGEDRAIRTPDNDPRFRILKEKADPASGFVLKNLK